jgi:amino-acid N-acetyltransferase
MGIEMEFTVLQQRRGVIDGIDYQATGEVRRLDIVRIKKRLEDNCIVILSNLGYSNTGEVLNCK